MNTQTHVLMGAALFGRRVPKRAWIAVAGSIAPDVPMLLIVLVLKLAGFPARQIFDELYWENWWQITNGVAHNFWLWGGLSILAIFMRDRGAATLASIQGWTLTFIFSASALLHSAIDFLCHREDAHMSLWPVTRWKFISPVSYWDDAHYGRWFGLFEAALGVTLCILLLQRFQNRWTRGALGVALALYVAIPAYFIFLH
jgi:membrane-bound metal-dependent hydrolase YbcI (DUF457 family)